MTTKHTPATPLPWFINGDSMYSTDQDKHGYHWNVATADSRFKPASAIQNAAYIAHAANAYPRLVAAVRGLITVSQGRQTSAAARALLRELGEDA